MQQATAAAAGPAADDTGRKVAFLRQVGAYPDLPARVEVVETHMSWVFLTPDRVYKLKKPVRRDYLDFSTVEARHRNCLEEVRLNRRLAPQIYLGVMPLTRAPEQGFALGGTAAPVDWLVVMRRLPVEASLEHRLRRGAAGPGEIERIAEVLAVFYRSAEPIPTDPLEYFRGFVASVARNRDELLDARYKLPIDRIMAVASALRGFLERHGELLERRAASRRIVDAHGDLRPEHIFLMPEPVIIDCLEFNRAMRLLDPAEELAYLSMECAHFGAPWADVPLFRAYRRRSGDDPPAALVRFHRSARALLRARLAIAHLKDVVVRDPAKWPAQALSYLDLALADARAL